MAICSVAWGAEVVRSLVATTVEGGGEFLPLADTKPRSQSILNSFKLTVESDAENTM